MKKILSIIVIAFLLLWNLTFAHFNSWLWRAELSIQKQELYKKQVDKVYKNFENILSKLNEEVQISKIKEMVWKIEKLLKNKNSDKNKLILSYLNDYQL
jgi:uncharacterized membrane protein YhiD involved in acid resistance